MGRGKFYQKFWERVVPRTVGDLLGEIDFYAPLKGFQGGI